MAEKIFTIAIPTYNRAAYLDRCLDNIVSQLNGYKEMVELIVSDNASNDNTTKIVQKYIDAGHSIKYIRNEENKGADFNIAQCYSNATGKYIVAFGDDDVFVTGAIETLVKFLQTADVGLVYVKNYAITDFSFPDKKVNPAEVTITTISDKKKFVKQVSYYNTFLSGNIINKSALLGLDLAAFYGSNLVQLPLILRAFKLFSKNAIVEDPLIAMQTENTGGYGLFKTFATNYVTMLNKEFATEEEKAYRDIIISDMLKTFFPFWIYRFKKKNNFQQGEDIHAIMYPLFKQYRNFWLYNFPLIKLNRLFTAIYFKATSKLLSVMQS